MPCPVLHRIALPVVSEWCQTVSVSVWLLLLIGGRLRGSWRHSWGLELGDPLHESADDPSRLRVGLALCF